MESRRRLDVEVQVTAKFLILDASTSSADTTDDFRVAISSSEGQSEAVNSIDTSIDVPAGVEVGEEVGISVGAPVGEADRVVGALVGATVGLLVGLFVGLVVGAVGATDGATVGLLVGLFVGLLVGLYVGLVVGAVGATDGATVGVVVGATVGATVGDVVGVFVGLLVGVSVDGPEGSQGVPRELPVVILIFSLYDVTLYALFSTYQEVFETSGNTMASNVSLYIYTRLFGMTSFNDATSSGISPQSMLSCNSIFLASSSRASSEGIFPVN